MGRKLNLNHLSEDECEEVLKVIQRDFELRQKEKERLGKIGEEVDRENSKTAILTQDKKFNENCCMRCFSRFFFLINTKVECSVCKFNVCKNCAEFVQESKTFVCKVCKKQDELEKQSSEWFYSNVREKFKRFGSAKVVRSLYKRKTDSESEGELGFSDSALYSSSNKRSRGKLTGLFEMNLDGDKAPRALQADSDSDEPVHEEIVATDRQDSQYTCNVGRKPFSEVRDNELKTFRLQQNNTVDQLQRALDNNRVPPGHNPYSATGHQHYDKIIENYTFQIADHLSTLSVNLHAALDNPEIAPPDTTPTLRSAIDKENYVREILVKEVENFTGVTIDQNKLSQTDNDRTPYEEKLSGLIVEKVVTDHQNYQAAKLQKEEQDLRKSLTKITNKATISQLSEQISESENDMDSSRQGDYDMSSRTSEISELSLVTREQEVESPPMLSPNSYHGNQDYNRSISKDTDPLNRSIDSRTSFDSGIKLRENGDSRLDKLKSPVLTSPEPVPSDTELDDIVRQNMIDDTWKNFESGALKESEIESEWRKVESKSPPPVSAGQGRLDMPVQEEALVKVNHNKTTSSPEYASQYNSAPQDSDIIRSKDAKDGRSAAMSIPQHKDYDSEETLDGSPVRERVVANTRSDQVSNVPNGDFNKYDDENRIPLPGFEDTGREEVDLDDISLLNGGQGSQSSDEEEGDLGYHSNVTFGSKWGSSPLFGRNKGIISAYDNFGSKKVGKDVQGPTMMLVPKGDEAPKVGDETIDQISDLSENDARSDITLDSSSEDEHSDEGGYFAEDGRFVTPRRHSKQIRRQTSKKEDTSVQTDDFEEYLKQQKASESQKAKPEKSKVKESQIQEKAKDVIEVQGEIQGDDPQFKLRPLDVTVEEGETAKFETAMVGTEPIDVFWYKDEATIKDMSDDDRCELRVKNGIHQLEVYNTTMADMGAYLVMAINDNGQCSKGFKLLVKENTNDKAGPEFLKSLQNTEVTEEGRVTLRAKITGYPHPRVLWFKDGKRIKSDDRIRIEKQGNRDYSLTVDYCTLDEDAEYSVIARNIAGEAKSRCQLIVEPKQEEVVSPKSPSVSSHPATMVTQRSTSSSNDALYPDTETLMKMTRDMQATRGRVTQTAENMLNNADKMSTINNQLDEMDKKLYSLEREVNDVNDLHNNNDNDTSLLEEQEEMTASAGAVHDVTITALDVLSQAQEVIDDQLKSMGIHDNNARSPYKPETASNTFKTEYFKPPTPIVIDEHEEVDLHLTYDETERLYDAGYLTREQIRKGAVSKSELYRIRQYLQQNSSQYSMDSFDRNHDIMIVDGHPKIDCGLKRVDSKRYKRDFVVNREGGPVRRNSKWLVKQPSSEGTEVVRSEGPTYLRKKSTAEEEMYAADISFDTSLDHDSALFDDQESYVSSGMEEIYMTAGKVYSLEDRIQELEGRVSETDDQTSVKQLDAIEDSVARMVAKVEQSEREVQEIEAKVNASMEHDRLRDQEPDWLEQKHDEPITRRISGMFEHKTATPTPIHVPKHKESASIHRPVASKQSPVRTHHSPVLSPTSPAPSMSPVPEAVVVTSKTVTLRGSSQEEDIPATRVETEPEVSMPSVKDLLSKFTHEKQPQEEPKHGGPAVRRVYSLTGRDLPRNVRENLRKGVVSHPNPNVRLSSQDPPRRPTASEVFHQPQQQQNVTQQPRSSTPKTGTQPTRTRLNSDPPQSPRSPVTSPVLQYSSQTSHSSSHGSSSPVSPAGSKQSKSSAIMARAAFWDNRIHEGQSDDSVVEGYFPELPEESFKSPVWGVLPDNTNQNDEFFYYSSSHRTDDV